MKVTKGFSEELKSCSWAKVDVELDEDDLLRLLLENDRSPESLTLSTAYAILSAEAERLLTVEYVLALKARDLDVPRALAIRLQDLTGLVKSKIALATKA
jgi:hypothetical protein